VRIIKRLTIATTYKCYSRCKHCHTWSRKSPRELSLDQYRELLSAGSFDSLGTISLTGGEPLLYSDIENLIRLIASAKPGIRLDINTNGLTFDKLNQVLSLEEIHSLGVFQINISMDGTKATHDYIRGVEGNYDRIIEWLTFFRPRIDNNVQVTLSFTASPQNYRDIPGIVQLAANFNTGLSLRMQQRSFFYDNVCEKLTWNEDSLRECNDLVRFVADHLVRKYGRLDSPHATFTKQAVWRYLNTARDYDCFAGRNSLYIDPSGNLYPCIMLDRKMGSIVDDSVEEILESDKSNRVVEYIKKRTCSCWTECETLYSISSQKDLFTQG